MTGKEWFLAKYGEALTDNPWTDLGDGNGTPGTPGGSSCPYVMTDEEWVARRRADGYKVVWGKSAKTGAECFLVSKGDES